jgi:hypothetical protein
VAFASGPGSAGAGGGASAEDGADAEGSDPHDINPTAIKRTPKIQAIFI